MPEEIADKKELGIIEVDSYGSVTREDSLSSLATPEELMKETGIKRVLSDTRKQESTRALLTSLILARTYPNP